MVNPSEMEDIFEKNKDGNYLYNDNEKRVVGTINYIRNMYSLILIDYRLRYSSESKCIFFRRYDGEKMTLKDVKYLESKFSMYYKMINHQIPPIIDCKCYTEAKKVKCFEANEWKKMRGNYKFYSGIFNFDV
jgi:hypothetical protein